MKNILKKVGVLGLIIAVLAPFIELPKVKAATGKDCKYHLQNYMFLDANYFNLVDGKTFLEGYKPDTTGIGYKTFTMFPNTFVNNSSNNTTIKWIDINNFGGNGKGNVDDLSKYWQLSKKQDQSLYIEENNLSHYNAQNISVGSALILDGTYSNSTYIDNAIIFHGVWTNYDQNGNKIYDAPSSTGITQEYNENYSLQKIFNKRAKLNMMSVDIDTSKANYSNNKYSFNVTNTDISRQYFQDIVDNKWSNISDSSSIIPMSINRTINLNDNDLNDFIYGFIDENNKVIVFTKKEKLDDVSDSYDTMKLWLEADKSTEELKQKAYEDYTINSVGDTTITQSSLDFNISKAYYWPVVLNVVYETCIETGTWGLDYDDNVDTLDVNNLPAASEPANLGTPIKVSDKVPTRKDHAFKGWCETKESCTKPYQPGDSFPSPNEEKTVILYAQWAEEGPGDQKKYGVMSYILGFTAVGIVAGGIYIISKKKNLFKQI